MVARLVDETMVADAGQLVLVQEKVLLLVLVLVLVGVRHEVTAVTTWAAGSRPHHPQPLRHAGKAVAVVPTPMTVCAATDHLP